MTYAQVNADMERAHALRTAMAWWNLLGWMGGSYR